MITSRLKINDWTVTPQCLFVADRCVWALGQFLAALEKLQLPDVIMVFKVPHTLGANHPEPVLGKRFKYPKGILGIFLCTIFRIIFVLVHLK